jgi:hypothetical protein
MTEINVEGLPEKTIEELAVLATAFAALSQKCLDLIKEKQNV